jgi:uncharacterized membrane protein HdeD (DUF308 family)
MGSGPFRSARKARFVHSGSCVRHEWPIHGSMDSTTADDGRIAQRRGRSARLVGAILFGAWAVYLAATSQFPVAFVIGAVAVLMGASYAARVGDPAVERGSFLLAGTLFVCAYFLVIFLVAGGACINQPTCSSGNIEANVALIALTATTCGAALSETLLAFRPSPARALWTRRLAGAAVAVIAVLYIGIRLSA